jgi:hypothetical protein
MNNDLKINTGPGSSNQPFKTPEQVAAREDQSSASPLLNNDFSVKDKLEPVRKSKKLNIKLWPPNKIGWIVIAVVVLVAAVCLWFFVFKKSPKIVAPPVVTTHIPKSSTVASSLTGLQVSPTANTLPVTAIMVENSLDARPQSGLGQAGVVFEALAEGGITRFVALYQSDSSSTNVGPIRSARPYFISWLLGFDADYAHVGGSPEALSDISQWGVKDLDEFYNGSYYQRISSRPAPHNVYTTLSRLYSLEQSKGYTSSKFTSWPRKTASPLKKPTATSITLNLSSSDYNVNYAYNAKTNSYERSEGGSPQMDADTNTQISVPVVIAMVIQESNGPLDGIGAYYSEYQTVGNGTAFIFQDGGVTEGQWTKSANTSQILFNTSAGKPLPLDPGEVWISAVTSDSSVIY